MGKIKFRISGTGGQGVITAGIILAEAAVVEDKEALQSQSYGPESRGGASKAEVIISDEQIFYPKVITPDVLVSLSQKSADKYGDEIHDGGIIIIDSSEVKGFKNERAKVYKIPITKLAKDEIGKTIVANIMTLGVLVALTEVVSFESLKKAVLHRIPKGTEELNLKALNMGYEEGKKAREE